MDIKTVNLNHKFEAVTEAWNPAIVGELNGQYVKIARFRDSFIRHRHEDEDEMFLVLRGELKMELDHKTLSVKQGEFVIIPKGTYHKPIAVGEAEVLLFEPKTTLNTGDKENELTRRTLDKL